MSMEAEVLQECGEARCFTAVGRKHGDHLFEILEYRVEEGGGLLVLVRLGWPHFTTIVDHSTLHFTTLVYHPHLTPDLLVVRQSYFHFQNRDQYGWRGLI